MSQSNDRRSRQTRHSKLKIAGGTAALAAVLGGGAAVAATQLSPTEESDAIVADAAKQLGVSADKLDAALKQALEAASTRP